MRSHLVIDEKNDRCLGALGSNHHRAWTFPLYTPKGLTVVQEFPFDHPFHNGCFVGQGPVKVGEREAGLWVSPPLAPDHHLFEGMGRMQAGEPEPYEREYGLGFQQEISWLDTNEQALIEETRRTEFIACDDATIVDIFSSKKSVYGDTEYPQSKYGSVGIRVEPRLLPFMGGQLLFDGGRSGVAEDLVDQQSDYVAYQNTLAGGHTFGVLMTIAIEGERGPWFIRDYGMALYNPTWDRSIHVEKGRSWDIKLRIVAYDDELTPDRFDLWRNTAFSPISKNF